MISLQELNPHNYPTTPEIEQNLKVLLERVNRIRMLWGQPMTVTSGLRSQADQNRINPNAPKSNHLIGAACDIYDPDRELQQWCKANEPALEQLGLWMEDFSATPTWCHFQCKAPKSGHRFFMP